MCRLLGSVSRTPVTVDELLGDGRSAFLEMASQHGDGWGHAWSTGESLQLRKAPDTALGSPELAHLAAREPAEAALTHLRWATLGLSVHHDNTHPFQHETVAFAHNGSISPPSALDRLIAPELAARRVGDTDSERFFLALLTRMRGRDVASALAATIGDVVASGARVHSLNCMLLTPTALYAACSYDPDSSDDLDYYPLLYRTSGDSVVVASTGWTDSTGWQTLGNGRLLVVERGSLRTTVLPIATPEYVAEAG